MIGGLIALAERCDFGRSNTDRPNDTSEDGLNRPATGRHDARGSVRSAAVAGKISHRTDRAARRGLRGRGERR